MLMSLTHLVGLVYTPHPTLPVTSPPAHLLVCTHARCIMVQAMKHRLRVCGLSIRPYFFHNKLLWCFKTTTTAANTLAS